MIPESYRPALTVTCWLNFSVTPVSHPFIQPFKKSSLKASCVPDLVAGIAEAVVSRRPRARPHEGSLIWKAHIESRFMNIKLKPRGRAV